MKKIKKCPRCGSKNVVEIVYGLPTYEARKLAEQKKLYLGGCTIFGMSPTHHCYGCGRNIGSPPVLLDRGVSSFASKECLQEYDYRKIVSFIKYDRSGFFPGHDVMVFQRKPDCFWVDAESSHFKYAKQGKLVQGDVHRQLSEKEWNYILDRLYTKLYLHEWKHSYYDGLSFVLDGATYKLTIKMQDGRKRVYEWDSGKVPPYFEELERTFAHILREDDYIL